MRVAIRIGVKSDAMPRSPGNVVAEAQRTGPSSSQFANKRKRMQTMPAAGLDATSFRNAVRRDAKTPELKDAGDAGDDDGIERANRRDGADGETDDDRRRYTRRASTRLLIPRRERGERDVAKKGTGTWFIHVPAMSKTIGADAEQRWSPSARHSRHRRGERTDTPRSSTRRRAADSRSTARRPARRARARAARQLETVNTNVLNRRPYRARKTRGSDRRGASSGP